MSSGRDVPSLSLNALMALAIGLCASFVGAPSWAGIALTAILFCLFQIPDALRDMA